MGKALLITMKWVENPLRRQVICRFVMSNPEMTMVPECNGDYCTSRGANTKHSPGPFWNICQQAWRSSGRNGSHFKVMHSKNIFWRSQTITYKTHAITQAVCDTKVSRSLPNIYNTISINRKKKNSPKHRKIGRCSFRWNMAVIMTHSYRNALAKMKPKILK